MAAPHPRLVGRGDRRQGRDEPRRRRQPCAGNDRFHRRHVPGGKERDRLVFGGTVDVCFFPARDTYIPDMVIAHAKRGMWGKSIRSEHVLLVGEIVSAGSVEEDRERKPLAAAWARIPVMLLIDPFAGPPSVTVHSDPVDGVYKQSVRAELGATVQLPKPVDVDLDTSIFIHHEEA
ncbi:Uma2 family endonuclease [Spongiactinospora sp. TRM90649]|uniref:Uma2 family endonuclease n=1 Tax=Spongiactinospora sp. TRM90649 TaxID=3031114 RepID=UPI0023F79B8E|nr:Uma2 family endonuclease [Spongiactinospora sp. TRM90649]MDF5751326.1 Uma2 family endonuclease [Spongiactinospora sp. TRM90649]